MAKATTTTSEAKPRRKARTLEEQLAELQSKVEAKQQRTKAKAEAQLAEVEDKIAAAHTKLVELTTQRQSLRSTLGLPADDDVPAEVDSADDSEA